MPLANEFYNYLDRVFKNNPVVRLFFSGGGSQDFTPTVTKTGNKWEISFSDTSTNSYTVSQVTYSVRRLGAMYNIQITSDSTNKSKNPNQTLSGKIIIQIG